MGFKVIAICGRKKHGKDTVGAILCDKYGFTPVAYADRLKQLARDVLLIEENFLWGPSELRESNVANADNPKYWIDCIKRVDGIADKIVETFKGHCPNPVTSLLVMLQNFEKLGSALTVRHVLQQMGTEWGRALWSEVWLFHAFESIQAINEGWGYNPHHGPFSYSGDEAHPTVKGVVITDCRFPKDEGKYVKDRGHTLWWVDASKRLREPFKAKQSRHASEPDLEDFASLKPKVVDNNGSLSDLKRNVQELMDHARLPE